MIAKQGCTIEHQNSNIKHHFLAIFVVSKYHFLCFLNKLNNSDQCDSSVDCLAHFSMRGNYSSLHPYQTDLWYVFLLFIFFTVVYSLNPSDLFGSLGVNHWTAWWGNSQRPSWNLITKKKIGKNIFPWFWTQVIWNIVNVVNHFFAIRMLVLRFSFFVFSMDFVGFDWED